MKKTILLALSLFCTAAFAQTGLYLQPEVGYGLGNARFVEPGYDPQAKITSVFSAQAGVGYQFHHLQLASSLGYMRTGFAAEIFETDIYGNIIGSGKEKARFNHIAIPLSIGYRLHLGKSCAITPVLGINATYNYSVADVVDINGYNHIDRITGSEFRRYYNSVSIFGMARANVEFALSPRLGIVLSPTYNYMLTNLYKNIHLYGGPNYKQHNYTFMLNAGIKWSLAKNREVKKSK